MLTHVSDLFVYIEIVIFVFRTADKQVYSALLHVVCWPEIYPNIFKVSPSGADSLTEMRILSWKYANQAI